MIQDLGQHHFQNQYHPEKKPGKEDFFLSFSGKSVLVKRESGKKVDSSDAIMSGDGLSLRTGKCLIPKGRAAGHGK